MIRRPVLVRLLTVLLVRVANTASNLILPVIPNSCNLFFAFLPMARMKLTMLRILSLLPGLTEIFSLPDVANLLPLLLPPLLFPLALLALLAHLTNRNLALRRRIASPPSFAISRNLLPLSLHLDAVLRTVILPISALPLLPPPLALPLQL